MRVLAIQHIDCEPLGSLETALMDAGATVDYLRPLAGDTLPATLAPWDAAVILGGPMSVYDGGLSSLEGEVRLVREAVETGTPLLGICLGSQVIAHAGGGRVYAGEVREAGWSQVELTAAAAGDPLFGGLPRRLRVFQLHGDTFELPRGAVRLAGNEHYPNQAFRLGDCVYGLQFHLEVTPALVREWADFYRDYIAGAAGSPDVLAELEARCAALAPAAARAAAVLLGRDGQA